LYPLERSDEKYSRLIYELRGLVRGFSSAAAVFSILPKLERRRSDLRRCKEMATELFELL
jgi:hypothetical protein